MPFSLKVKQFAFKCLLIVNHPKASEHGRLGIEENEHAGLQSNRLYTMVLVGWTQ